LRANPDYVTDPRKNAKLNAAHHDAVAEGHAPSSDGYLAHIERFVGLPGGSNENCGHSDNSSPRQAPPRTIKMSREQYERAKETAESLNLSLPEYLRRKHIMDNSPEWNWRQEFGA
jgi:hypothetical protein